MYPINAQVVDVMSRLQRRMELKMEAAWGPESISASVAGETAQPGTLGAVNPSDADDAFNAYINNIIDQLIASCDMDENEAIDYVFDCADELSTLPPIPEEGAPAIEVSTWLGTANSVEFGGYVLGRAQSNV